MTEDFNQSYLPLSFSSQKKTIAQMSKFIKSFTTIPKDMFRVNNGSSVYLRDRAVKRTAKYDLLTEAGKVKPKALDPNSYTRIVLSSYNKETSDCE